ncbi:hypothetical protein BDZ97DRAFT_1919416 [Flammula alnicola]|nr:hypothetical protein BDZ97DRAFT_1919416 [Flammula alnicola]
MATTISRRCLFATRILAVTSFTAYVYLYTHALFLPSPKVTKPYSPNIYFVISYFVASALLNIYWLRQLFFTWDYAGDIMPLAYGWDEDSAFVVKDKKSPFRPALPKFYRLSSAQVTCLPFYILGNVFLIAWSFAWINGSFLISQILLACNLSAQLYTVFMLLHVEHDEHITPINYMTHLVMKTNAGLAVLFMWMNWGVIDQIVSPTIAEMINSGVIFLLMTVGSGPDPTLGLCLLYDLTALIFGQPKSEPWYHAFHWIMIMICICLLVELHLSERQQFSWLKGFDDTTTYSARVEILLADDIEEDIEYGLSDASLIPSWEKGGAPPCHSITA